MPIDYATKYAKQIDENFTLQSITERAVNHDFDFVGAKTVKVYSVSTAPMNDYQMRGKDRYGSPEELDATTQEMTMTQDKAFTFTIDKRNADETGDALNAGKALARQQSEVITPMIDAYRLQTIAGNAGRVVVGDYTGAVKPYERFLDGDAFLADEKVPVEGRVAYVTSAFYKRLKLDESFIMAKDIDTDKLTKGQVGEIDNVPVIRAPRGYLPAGVSMLITHPIATPAPQKIAEYKIHNNPPGISGDLAEGRVYFDAFVLKNKRNAIYVLRGEMGDLALRVTPGEVGKSVVQVVGGTTSDMTLVYKTNGSVAVPALGADVASGWTALPEDGSIAATAANYLVVVGAIGGKVAAAARVQLTADMIGAE